MDLVLNLPSDGIRLVFDPVNQRLKVSNNLQLFKQLDSVKMHIHVHACVVAAADTWKDKQTEY